MVISSAQLGDRKLDAIGDEDVQHLKAALVTRSRKTACRHAGADGGWTRTGQGARARARRGQLLSCSRNRARGPGRNSQAMAQEELQGRLNSRRRTRSPVGRVCERLDA
jgi:hypothetical protein